MLSNILITQRIIATIIQQFRYNIYVENLFINSQHNEIS